jgi:hypothetical protein
MPVPGPESAEFGLSDWSPEAIAALRAHPRFVEAAHQFAQCMLSLYRGNRLVNQLTNDRGRTLLGFLILNLHFSRRPDDPQSGLTAGRVVDFCVEHKICSRGRAKALLMLMRVAGYLAPAEGADDRRYRVLVPTERMLELQQARWRCLFDSMALIMPEGATARSMQEQPEFQRRLLARLVQYFVAGNRLLDHVPELIDFVDRNAGLLILMSLFLAGDPEHPERPAAVSISGLASRFSVSRAHVLKFLRDAIEAGWIERGEPEQIVLRPRFLDIMHTFIASGFLLNALAVREALADMPS